LPAILSIAHRGSGIALTGVISAAAIGLMVHPLAFYVDAVKVRVLHSLHSLHPRFPHTCMAGLATQALEMAPVLFTATKFTLAFPFTYHTFNGVRHLARGQPSALLVDVGCSHRSPLQVWDTARSLGLSDIYTNGYSTVGLALATSAALALL
jgi:succinate dehydrogenase (ubiquinone) cytochrome b560 subunit